MSNFIYPLNLNFPGKYTFTIPPGKYLIECWGAQGGTGLNEGMHKTEGGKGSYASGILKVNQKTALYCFVGGKGGDGIPQTNQAASGGYNGGGTGGADLKDYDAAGGGGGASDVRYIDGDCDDSTSMNSRIIVAGGGSGSTYSSSGAPGGGVSYGYAKNGNGFDAIIKKTDLKINGIGGNGNAHRNYPSSGGGGGYYGGISVSGNSDQPYAAVSYSGSSYVSGYENLPTVKYILLDPKIIDGSQESNAPNGDTQTGNSGNGSIKITPISINEYVCTSRKSITSFAFYLLFIIICSKV